MWDSVRLEENGDLMCAQAGGWLPYDGWSPIDSQVAVSFDKSLVSKVRVYREEYAQQLKAFEDLIKNL